MPKVRRGTLRIVLVANTTFVDNFKIAKEELNACKMPVLKMQGQMYRCLPSSPTQT
jgi:hypothetical protein